MGDEGFNCVGNGQKNVVENKKKMTIKLSKLMEINIKGKKDGNRITFFK